MKKLISILLTLSLLMSAVSVGAATLDNGSGDLSAEETGLMTRLEILSSDDMFSYGKNFEIPRAAFIRIADRIVKAQSADSAELPFWDVNSGNEYYSDIAAAYSFGLIDGGVGDSFRPYDIITYNEAIKIVSVMLGYKAFAAVNGGYPLGYVAAAKTAGVSMSGVGGEQKLTYKQAARLLFDSLTAAMLEQSAYGDTVSYTTDKNNTILKQYYDIDVVYGVVNATDITNITYGGEFADNQIIVGDTVFKCADPAPYRNLIGYRVNCYFDKSSDLKDIIYMAKSRNKTLTVDADEITGVSKSTISYCDENTDRESKIEVSRFASYIYNGMAIDYSAQYSDSLIGDIDSGSVEFVDNDSNGTYDVIIITSYEDYVVKSVNKTDNEIYGEYNGGTPLKLDEDVKWQIADQSGKTYTLSDISKGASLMAAKSFDGSYVNVIYSDDIIEGRAASMKGDNKVKINDKEYKISKRYLENGTKIIAGTTGVFYLNAAGRIVQFELAGMGGGKFGMLMRVKRESELSDNVSVSVMSAEEDKALTFALEKSVEVDGITRRGADKIIGALNPNGKTAIAEVVRYWINDDGKIYKFDTPTVSDRESEDNTLVKRWDMTDSGLGWKNSGRLGSKFYINTSSGTLYGLNDAVSSAADVTVYAPNTLSDDANCECDVYSVGADTIKVDVMVMKKSGIEGSGGGQQAPTDSYFCVFESYSHELDADGDTIGVITYYDGQSKTNAYVKTEDEDRIPALAELNCGDAFYIKKDKKNYLNVHLNQDKGYTNLYRIYDYENDEFIYDTALDDGHWRLSTGIVYDLEDTYARVGEKGIDYNSMTFREKDTQLTTYLIYYAYNGGGIYEVLKDGTLKVTVPSADTVQPYSSVGDSADRIIAQREYGHDRRNCYFRHNDN